MHQIVEQITIEGKSKRVLVSVGKYFMEVFDDNQALTHALKNQQKPYRFIRSKANPYYGRNQRMNLIHDNGRAIMIWKRRKSELGIYGILCSTLINDSEISTLDLIVDGVKLARDNWDDQHFYTYLDPKSDKFNDLSKAYLKAGWKKAGVTQRNFEIFTVELE